MLNIRVFYRFAKIGKCFGLPVPSHSTGGRMKIVLVIIPKNNYLCPPFKRR
jgi:hypothetical protein